MSLKDFIANHIYGPSDGKQPEVVKEKVAVAKPAAASAPTSESANPQSAPGAPPIISSGTGVSLPDLDTARSQITQAIADKNRPGNDYFEFMQVLGRPAMKSVPTESQRYQLAFDSLSVAGLTRETLMSTGRFYAEVVEAELKEFEVGFNALFSAQVTSKMAEAEKKQTHMRELNEQLEKLAAEIRAIGDEVTASETTLHLKRNAFLRAGSEARDTIASELTKIDTYISAQT